MSDEELRALLLKEIAELQLGSHAGDMEASGSTHPLQRRMEARRRELPRKT